MYVIRIDPNTSLLRATMITDRIHKISNSTMSVAQIKEHLETHKDALGEYPQFSLTDDKYAKLVAGIEKTRSFALSEAFTATYHQLNTLVKVFHIVINNDATVKQLRTLHSYIDECYGKINDFDFLLTEESYNLMIERVIEDSDDMLLYIFIATVL